MKSPIDTVKGTIVDISPEGILTIKAHYDDYLTLIRREYKQCDITLIDSRPLSDKQRKACYAMIGEISEFSGMGKEKTKEYMKLKFMSEDLQQTADHLFSLSNAPMSLVCAFQKFLVNFIIEWNVPTHKPLIDYVDDVHDYVYSCLQNKKCAVCGKLAEVHHCEGSRIGMGNDRTEIVQEGLEVLPLCRIHHTEVHLMPEDEFIEMYHLGSGVIIDKFICKIYGFKKAEG